MAIFHFKHSYLDWRAIPYKRRNYLCLAFFFLNLAFFCLDWSNYSSAWYDNHFLFFVHFFFFSFSCSVYSEQQRMSSMTFQIEAPLLMRELFWKGLAFGPRLFVPVFSKERIMAQKVFSKNGQFLVNMPQDINQGDSRVSRSWDFVLLIEKVWSYSKSWCIPNYQLSVPTKIHFLYCLISNEFEKSFWVRNFLACCLGRQDQKVYLIF